MSSRGKQSRNGFLEYSVVLRSCQCPQRVGPVVGRALAWEKAVVLKLAMPACRVATDVAPELQMLVAGRRRLDLFNLDRISYTHSVRVYGHITRNLRWSTSGNLIG